MLNINIHGENHDQEILPSSPQSSEKGEYGVPVEGQVIIGVHARHSRGSVRSKENLNAVRQDAITTDTHPLNVLLYDIISLTTHPLTRHTPSYSPHTL